MNKLQRTIAHALAYYMYARMNGQDGDVQLRRLKRLQKAYEDTTTKERREPDYVAGASC